MFVWSTIATLLRWKRQDIDPKRSSYYRLGNLIDYTFDKRLLDYTLVRHHRRRCFVKENKRNSESKKKVFLIPVIGYIDMNEFPSVFFVLSPNNTALEPCGNRTTRLHWPFTFQSQFHLSCLFMHFSHFMRSAWGKNGGNVHVEFSFIKKPLHLFIYTYFSLSF